MAVAGASDESGAIASLKALEQLLRARKPGESVRELYDRIASNYEAFRELWLALVGREAEAAMIEDLQKTLFPGAAVLDAGAGTGAISRQVFALEPEARLTMLDISPAMLDRAAELPAERVVGDIAALPFGEDRFDIIVCAWVVETLPDPMQAVTELLRVLAPSGHLFYTFTSLPNGWLSRAGTAFLRKVIEGQFAGRSLTEEKTPWYDCGLSHWRRFTGGLTSEIALRKCCQVPRSLAAAERAR